MLTANSQQQAPLQRGLMAVWAWHSAHCVCKLVIRIVAAPCRVVILITSACLPVLLSALWPLPCFSLTLFLSVCLPVPLPVCLSLCLFICLSHVVLADPFTNALESLPQPPLVHRPNRARRQGSQESSSITLPAINYLPQLAT